MGNVELAMGNVNPLTSCHWLLYGAIVVGVSPLRPLRLCAFARTLSSISRQGAKTQRPQRRGRLFLKDYQLRRHPSFPVDNRQSVKHSPLCRLSRGHMKKTQTDLLQGTLDLLALTAYVCRLTCLPHSCATRDKGGSSGGVTVRISA